MFRAIAVVAMGWGLAVGIGVAAAFTGKTGHWLLAVVAVLGVAATASLAGFYAERAWALQVGVVAGLVAPIAGILGNYFAYEFGIWGLDSRDFGSPDTPGEAYLLISVIIFSPVLFGVSAITGVLAVLGQSRRSDAHPLRRQSPS